MEGKTNERPLIGPSHEGIPEALNDGVNGFLVGYASQEQLARVIITVLQDSDLAKRMGCAGRLRILHDFTWQPASDCIESIHSELVPPKAAMGAMP